MIGIRPLEWRVWNERVTRNLSHRLQDTLVGDVPSQQLLLDHAATKSRSDFVVRMIGLQRLRIHRGLLNMSTSWSKASLIESMGLINRFRENSRTSSVCQLSVR